MRELDGGGGGATEEGARGAVSAPFSAFSVVLKAGSRGMQAMFQYLLQSCGKQKFGQVLPMFVHFLCWLSCAAAAYGTGTSSGRSITLRRSWQV